MHGYPWGVLQVPSSIVRAIYAKVSLGSAEHPFFETSANFPCMHPEMGANPPHLAEHAFAGK